MVGWGAAGGRWGWNRGRGREGRGAERWLDRRRAPAHTKRTWVFLLATKPAPQGLPPAGCALPSCPVGSPCRCAGPGKGAGAEATRRARSLLHPSGHRGPRRSSGFWTYLADILRREIRRWTGTPREGRAKAGRGVSGPAEHPAVPRGSGKDSPQGTWVARGAGMQASLLLTQTAGWRDAGSTCPSLSPPVACWAQGPAAGRANTSCLCDIGLLCLGSPP